MKHEEFKTKYDKIKGLTSLIVKMRKARDYLAEPASKQESKKYIATVKKRDVLWDELYTEIVSGDYLKLDRKQSTRGVKYLLIEYRKNINIHYINLVHKDNIGELKGKPFTGTKDKIINVYVYSSWI
jgi:beta-N-acetylglucosaminidase